MRISLASTGTKFILALGLLLSVNAYAVAPTWQSNTVIVNQHKLHYYQTGKGAPVVLLTGYATSSNFWNARFVNCLAKKNSVYLFDYWGIGTDNDAAGNASIEAMAKDAHSLSSALKLDKPTLVGWSMGGAVAQQMSFTYPDDVGKVALISPLMLDNQPVESSGETLVELNSYADVLNYVFANNLYDYTPAQLKFYQTGLFTPKGKLFPSNEVGINQHDAMNKWSSSTATEDAILRSDKEYLVLIANQDKMLNPANTEMDAKQFEHVHIAKFDGSGHNISMQAPDQTCAQIEEFISN